MKMLNRVLAALSTMALFALFGVKPFHDEPFGSATVSKTIAPTQAVNVYGDASFAKLTRTAANALPRVYVPNLRSGDVYVIDPSRFQVVDRYKVGGSPEHVVPAWDLKTLWAVGVADGKRGEAGSLTPIDPLTGKPGSTIRVRDAYNMYFTPDGKSAIVVAEALKQLEFRDPQTMALQGSLKVPGCPGINHADYAIDASYVIFTCEFAGTLVKIDLATHRILGYLQLICTTPQAAKLSHSMPQDIRISPDGKFFFVADMLADGIFVIDGHEFVQTGFIPTGVGAHGLYPSRDGTHLYIANRGSHSIHGPRNGPGSISVLDFKTQRIAITWPIPGGGSPDMGNVSADGKLLWLSGRFDDVVYAINTTNGEVKKIPVGAEPHGLTVWPQPGRYSLGHTGNMR
jgi:YVTN family beta-propeller protein